jgi:uncharacterized protein (TIGR03032 family)
VTDPATVMREPDQVLSLSATGWPWDPRAIDYDVSGAFIEVLAELGVTLVVSREYEHFVMALSADADGLDISVARLPHPSGIAIDRTNSLVHIACTRNPNQLLTYGISAGSLRRDDSVTATSDQQRLAPISSRFLPGCMYLHDLAIIGDRLCGNAVGMNAIVDLSAADPRPTWWPESIEASGTPEHGRNLIQLNSIAAGPTLAASYFTASTEAPGDRLPGDPHWDVDRRGVVFGGDRSVIARGLTRPHSARLDNDGVLWVDDSGYGRLCRIDTGTAATGTAATGTVETVATLGGWTRGLCLIDRIAVVGTSRVLPRFSAYAPGLHPDTSRCGLHLVDLATGGLLGSLWFAHGDQIFAIDWLARTTARHFVGGSSQTDPEATTAAWYSFRPASMPIQPTVSPASSTSPPNTETPP